MIHNDRAFLRQDFAKQVKNFKSVGFLASDMSKRQYYRVLAGDASYVLMDAPDKEELDRFLKIQQILIDVGIRAPKKFKQDLENGFLLMEDFGDTTLTKALNDETLKKNEYTFYKKSISILHSIYEAYDFDLTPIPAYNVDAHLQEVGVFADCYFPFIHQKQMDASTKNDWLNLWKISLQEVLPLAPNTLVLRDYHVDNIVLLKDGNLGVLDFQDALFGSVLYDYISLVEDARRVIDEHLVQKVTADFLSIFDQSKHKDYVYHAAVIGAARHAKILGVFSRYKILHKNDSKLCYIPHVKKLLIKALERAEQKDLLYFLKDQGFLKKVDLS